MQEFSDGFTAYRITYFSNSCVNEIRVCGVLCLWFVDRLLFSIVPGVNLRRVFKG